MKPTNDMNISIVSDSIIFICNYVFLQWSRSCRYPSAPNIFGKAYVAIDQIDAATRSPEMLLSIRIGKSSAFKLQKLTGWQPLCRCGILMSSTAVHLLSARDSGGWRRQRLIEISALVPPALWLPWHNCCSHCVKIATATQHLNLKKKNGGGADGTQPAAVSARACSGWG